MAKLNDESAVFLNDCVSFNHPSLGCTKGVIKKFFHKVSVSISITEGYPVAVSQDVSHDIFAKVDMLLDLPQFQHMVPDTLAMHLERGYLILHGCIIVPVHNILGFAEKPQFVIKWDLQHFVRMDQQVCTLELSYLAYTY